MLKAMWTSAQSAGDVSGGLMSRAPNAFSAQRRDALLQRLSGVDGGAGPVRDEGTGRGEPGPARGAFEHGDADGAFQGADAGADRGLADSVRGGRAACNGPLSEVSLPDASIASRLGHDLSSATGTRARQRIQFWRWTFADS